MKTPFNSPAPSASSLNQISFERHQPFEPGSNSLPNDLSPRSNHIASHNDLCINLGMNAPTIRTPYLIGQDNRGFSEEDYEHHWNTARHQRQVNLTIHKVFSMLT